MLHLGTLEAVLAYFTRDVRALLADAGRLFRLPRESWRSDPHSRLFALLVLGTIPAVAAGAQFQHAFQSAFSSVPGTAGFLLVTALMLVLITWRRIGERPMHTATWKDALLVGLFQAVAILPGISRSGAPITAGLLRGFDREAAPRFSFLLSIPIILGGGAMGIRDLTVAPHSSLSLPC